MGVEDSPPPPAGANEKVLELAEFATLLEQNKLKEAKILLRNSTPEPKDIAEAWKLILATYTRDTPMDTSSIYWDTVSTCYGSSDIKECTGRTPGCVDSAHTPSYSLQAEERTQVYRLVTCVAYTSPDVPYSPLLFPIAAILRKHLNEEECFGVLCMMLSPPSSVSFLTQSKKSWEVLRKSLKPLALKYVKKHISTLERESGSAAVEKVLENWIWILFEQLPFPFLERLFTSFLLEGYKVLYRGGLSLIKLYARALSSGKALADLKSNSIDQELPKFCAGLKVAPSELMRVSFKIPRLSKSDVIKIQLKLEMEIKSSKLVGSENARRRSNVEYLSVDGGNDIVAVSDTLTYKQGMSTPQLKPKSSSVFSIHHLKSEILGKEDLNKLWDMLPERITMIVPKLVYTSNDHGTSLKTFYKRSEHYEPTILLVKTTQGDIFGAYCSAPWRTRNERDDRGMQQRYFGTGESFLFRVEGESISKYGWVGDESAESLDTAQQLFMSGDNTYISIGGGEGTGIYIDENLDNGRTEHCRTFNNPPLASTKDFNISVIETIGFNNTEW